MSNPALDPQTIRARHWRWLTTEAEAWVRDGLIDDAQRERIVGRYQSDASAAEHRGLTALKALAALAAAIAVLLLIGYNWSEIPRAGKVAMIFGAVAATFAASAIAYARGKDNTGELLAFTGTLFYGNAIWLLAQVFHISGHYPDGALWWAIGALIAAHMLKARTIGLQAIVVVGVWVLMEMSFMAGMNYMFLPVGAAAFWFAYRVRSTWVLGLSALVTVVWAISNAASGLRAEDLTIGLGVLIGCGFYAMSRLHEERTSFQRLWEILSVFVMAVFLVPLMVHALHSGSPDLPAASRIPMIAMTLSPIALMAFAAIRAERRPLDLAVYLAAALTLAWMVWVVAAPSGAWTPTMRWAAVIGFSGAMLFTGVTLMRAGMRQSRGWLFTSGVIYVLLFLLVRWLDLLGSMVWSALFLFGVAALLFWVARLWRSARS